MNETEHGIMGRISTFLFRSFSKSQTNESIVSLNNSAHPKLWYACDDWFQGVEQKAFQSY